MAENSETIEARLCAYVEGALDEAERAEIERHLEIHPQHRRLLAELSAQRDWLRDLPHEKAPADLLETVDARLERSALLETPAPQRDRAPGPRLWVAAAAVALAAGLGVLVYTTLPHKPAAYQQYASVDRPAPTTSTAATNDESRASVRRRDSGATSDAAESTATSTTGMNVESPAVDLTSRPELAEPAAPPVTDRVVLVVQADDPRIAHGRVREFFAQNHLSWSDASAGWGGYAAAPTVLAQSAANSPRSAAGMGGFGGAAQGVAPYPPASAAAQPPPGPASRPASSKLGETDVAAQRGAGFGVRRGMTVDAAPAAEASSTTVTAYQTIMTRSQAASLQDALAAPEVTRLRDQVQAYGLRLESATATTQPAQAGLGAAIDSPPLVLNSREALRERMSSGPATSPTGGEVIPDELTLRTSPPLAKPGGVPATSGPSVGELPSTRPVDVSEAPVEVVVLIEFPATPTTRPADSRPTTQPRKAGR